MLDLGGGDVNGSYRDVFDGPQFAYLGADLAPAEGVSVVLDNPYRFPLDDASIDIVASGQMFEHCEFFWLAFAGMVRVVKPSGFVFLIAPAAGAIHRYPAGGGLCLTGSRGTRGRAARRRTGAAPRRAAGAREKAPWRTRFAGGGTTAAPRPKGRPRRRAA